MTKYPETIYGWCFSRVIHFVVALRAEHPGTRIFISKYDFSDAYPRVAHKARAAAQTILVMVQVAYIMLRLAFGGSPNPPAWCAFSEMVTDLANEIPLRPSWDPAKLRSPAQPETPASRELPDDIPLARACPIAVRVPTSVTARTDCFIDDIILGCLDTPTNRQRQPHTVPLAVYVANRPNAGATEPMPRRENISEPKLIAEGTPIEEQIVLGWAIESRRLIVRLPGDKFMAWSVDIAEILRTGTVTFGDLKLCVSRLNDAAYVIPLGRHFLGRLYERITPARPKRQQLTLTQVELDDLKTWLHFLDNARTGISMNLLTPTNIGISDSCPYGLGGVT
jgi:hypothetical protein